MLDALVEAQPPTARVGARVGLSDALRARSRAAAAGAIRLADAPARALPARLEPPARGLASPEARDHRRQDRVHGRHGRHARPLGYLRASRRRPAADRSVGAALSARITTSRSCATARRPPRSAKLARERWKRAGGRLRRPVRTTGDPWPASRAPGPRERGGGDRAHRAGLRRPAARRRDRERVARSDPRARSARSTSRTST